MLSDSLGPAPVWRSAAKGPRASRFSRPSSQCKSALEVVLDSIEAPAGLMMGD